MRTNVIFHYEEGPVVVEDVEDVVSIDGALWFQDLLEREPSVTDVLWYRDVRDGSPGTRSPGEA